MRIKWTKTLWKNAKHSAFTDLCEFSGNLYCCFREATNHVSQDGRIVVVRVNTEGEKLQSWFISFENVDLRDPKLTINAEGKLILLAYGRRFDQNGNWEYSKPLCWFSANGESWSGEHWFGDKNWWLWRLTYHNNTAYGFAYNRTAQTLNLYSGDPLRAIHVVKYSVLGLQTHGLGYPNESDICFNKNGKAFAVVRRDADSFSAQFGISTPPYQQWQWHDLGQYIGAPAIMLWDEKNLLVSGRIWRNQQLKTAIWKLNIEMKRLSLLVELESAGDNSYPGLVRDDQDLYVSYYSSHVDNISAIYLTKINGVRADETSHLADIVK